MDIFAVLGVQLVARQLVKLANEFRWVESTNILQGQGYFCPRIQQDATGHGHTDRCEFQFAMDESSGLRGSEVMEVMEDELKNGCTFVCWLTRAIMKKADLLWP